MLTASESLAAPLGPLLPVVEQPVMVQTHRLLTELSPLVGASYFWSVSRDCSSAYAAANIIMKARLSLL